MLDPSTIVAVASAAGDLEAVSEMLCANGAECDLAFLIVQHLGTVRRDVSLNTQLANRINMPIVIAHDGTPPRRGHVYLVGTNATMSFSGGCIRVRSGANEIDNPGDILLTSLAEALGPSAIGVVLSGGGADGALGIQAISQVGGVTFAQFPGSARFPSMPINAIETRCVDSVLRPNEIAREISRLSRRNSDPPTNTRGVPLRSVSVAGNYCCNLVDGRPHARAHSKLPLGNSNAGAATNGNVGQI